MENNQQTNALDHQWTHGVQELPAFTDFDGFKVEGSVSYDSPTETKELVRIIYVEDDSSLRSVVSYALSKIPGLVVETCANSYEALKLAPLFKPQLVLLDADIEGMDGAEMLTNLRQIRGLENIDAIVLSAMKTSKYHEMFEMLDSLALIPKPFDLSSIAQEILDIWQSKEEASLGG